MADIIKSVTDDRLDAFLDQLLSYVETRQCPNCREKLPWYNAKDGLDIAKFVTDLRHGKPGTAKGDETPVEHLFAKSVANMTHDERDTARAWALRHLDDKDLLPT